MRAEHATRHVPASETPVYPALFRDFLAEHRYMELLLERLEAIISGKDIPDRRAHAADIAHYLRVDFHLYLDDEGTLIELIMSRSPLHPRTSRAISDAHQAHGVLRRMSAIVADTLMQFHEDRPTTRPEPFSSGFQVLCRRFVQTLQTHFRRSRANLYPIATELLTAPMIETFGTETTLRRRTVGAPNRGFLAKSENAAG